MLGGLGMLGGLSLGFRLLAAADIRICIGDDRFEEGPKGIGRIRLDSLDDDGVADQALSASAT